MALVAIAVAVGIAFGLGAATFAIVVYTALFAGLTMLGVTPLQALPSLNVGLWVDGERLARTYAHRTDRPRAPIDIDACIRNAVAEIRKGIPPPLPKPGPLLGTLGVAAFQEAALGTQIYFGGETRDAAVKRLHLEIQTYEAEFREWLEGFSARRTPRARLIREPVAIHNGGESVADGIILRLRMPLGIVAMTAERLEALEVSAPPEAPRYKQKSRYDVASVLAMRTPAFPTFPVIPALRPGATGPTWTREQDPDVAEVRLATLTHGVTEVTADTLAILPREPGTYEIAWDAHVGNLRRPARGTIRVEVEPMPEGGEPLTTLEEVLQTGDVEVNGGGDYRP